jgi:mono/diheme cytochrome c family protein
MKKFRVAAVVATLLSVSLLSACGSARRGEPITGPVAFDAPPLQRGRLVFDRNCYKCHAQGEGAMAAAMNDKPLPKFLMRLQVRTGLIGSMPAFSKEQISDQELDDLLDYIVALRRSG